MADPTNEKGRIDPDIEKNLPDPLADAIRNGSISKGILEHSHDADEAMKAFMSHQGTVIEIDEATNRRLLRKIDWNLMPIMCVVYGLNYLDKTTISYASIMGIKKDIGLVGDDYQWLGEFCLVTSKKWEGYRLIVRLGSLFYFGYLAWEYPTNRLLQRLPLGKYSSFNIIMWGITLSCFAAVKNFSGAVAIRFFLGVFESAVTPGFALFTSQWYTKREQGLRVGIWFRFVREDLPIESSVLTFCSFNGFAQIFGGLVAYGIARGTAIHGSSIEPWKIVFLLTGCMTITVGLIFLWAMPDNQLNARWLSPEDRVLCVERVRINQQGIGNKHFKMYQLKEALLDPLTWAFFFYALVADIPNGKSDSTNSLTSFPPFSKLPLSTP